MNGEQWQGPEGQDVDAGELVTLEPVVVNQKHLGRIMTALRQRDIYFQIGERLPGHRIVLFVLPDDQEHAEHLASMASLPLAGCRWLAIAAMAMVGLVIVVGCLPILV